jgi:hypothetical protein
MRAEASCSAAATLACAMAEADPIDGENVAGLELGSDRSCRCAQPASDLKDAEVQVPGQRIHDGGEARRQT